MNKAFIPVMLTPFKADGAVDYDTLGRLTEYYINAGARGLFANCLSSEMYELSEEERLQVVRQVVHASNGRVPVVATGTFHRDLQVQADFIRKIHDLGTQGVIVITSLMAEEQEADERLNDRVFDLIARTGNIPLGFYECPRPYKRLLSPQQLKAFVETGRVQYHKDTCLDIEQVKAKIAACPQLDFGLYDAYMVNAVASLKAGAAGLSCIQGNYFPQLVSWLCDHFDRDDLTEEIQHVQDFFTANMDLMHDVYPYSAKYILQQQGVPISTVVRTPGKAFTPPFQARIDALLLSYRQLADRLYSQVEA